MSIGPHVNLCMLCMACFLMLKHWFVGSTNTINFIDICSFIPLSGCTGNDPQCTALNGDL